MVEIAARLEIQPEVKTSAASLPCRSASSRSSSTMAWLVPEMLRVPPAPAPTLRRGLDHGVDHLRVLAHAEIIVGAPDGDILGFTVRTMPHRLGETLHIALDMGEDPIAPFRTKTEDSCLEVAPINHAEALHSTRHSRDTRPWAPLPGPPNTVRNLT